MVVANDCVSLLFLYNFIGGIRKVIYIFLIGLVVTFSISSSLKYIKSP
jgi:hypothetical protein